MNVAAIIALIALPLFPAVAAAASAPKTSWGKAGVSFDQYRTDAVDCGRAGFATDIVDTDAVKALKRASSEIDDALNTQAFTADDAARTGQRVANARGFANPERRFKEISAMQMGTLAQCLIGRGYHQFTLNDAQREQLSKLAAGSPERHAFLHRLASDPGVLETQGL